MIGGIVGCACLKAYPFAVQFPVIAEPSVTHLCQFFIFTIVQYVTIYRKHICFSIISRRIDLFVSEFFCHASRGVQNHHYV